MIIWQIGIEVSIGGRIVSFETEKEAREFSAWAVRKFILEV